MCIRITPLHNQRGARRARRINQECSACSAVIVLLPALSSAGFASASASFSFAATASALGRSFPASMTLAVAFSLPLAFAFALPFAAPFDGRLGILRVLRRSNGRERRHERRTNQDFLEHFAPAWLHLAENRVESIVVLL